MFIVAYKLRSLCTVSFKIFETTESNVYNKLEQTTISVWNLTSSGACVCMTSRGQFKRLLWNKTSLNNNKILRNTISPTEKWGAKSPIDELRYRKFGFPEYFAKFNGSTLSADSVFEKLFTKGMKLYQFINIGFRFIWIGLSFLNRIRIEPVNWGITNARKTHLGNWMVIDGTADSFGLSHFNYVGTYAHFEPSHWEWMINIAGSREIYDSIRPFLSESWITRTKFLVICNNLIRELKVYSDLWIYSTYEWSICFNEISTRSNYRTPFESILKTNAKNIIYLN